jgi:hypothetical protein
LRDRLVVVVGYGGWDDEFTRMMSSLVDPRSIGLEIAWAFYSHRAQDIIGSYLPLLERFEPWRPSGRFQPYVGIKEVRSFR